MVLPEEPFDLDAEFRVAWVRSFCLGAYPEGFDGDEEDFCPPCLLPSLLFCGGPGRYPNLGNSNWKSILLRFWRP